VIALGTEMPALAHPSDSRGPFVNLEET
jgi:hypothetical protein